MRLHVSICTSHRIYRPAISNRQVRHNVSKLPLVRRVLWEGIGDQFGHQSEDRFRVRREPQHVIAEPFGTHECVRKGRHGSKQSSEREPDVVIDVLGRHERKQDSHVRGDTQPRDWIEFTPQLAYCRFSLPDHDDQGTPSISHLGRLREDLWTLAMKHEEHGFPLMTWCLGGATPPHQVPPLPVLRRATMTCDLRAQLRFLVFGSGGSDLRVFMAKRDCSRASPGSAIRYSVMNRS